MHETETTATAAPFRERLSRGVFRRQVREKLAAELAKAAKKKGAAFGPAAVPAIVAEVSDAEIDQAAAQAQTAAASPLVGGPILDWIKANPELVAKVVQILLALILGV